MTESYGAGPSTDPPRVDPRRRYLIGLSVGAALVLVTGVIVAVAGGGGDRRADPPGPTPSVTAAPGTATSASPPPSTTTTTTPTTTTTTTTTTTSTTPASTVPPVPAVAEAGDDRVVDVGARVALVAADLPEPDLSVVWRQRAGPDVIGGRPLVLGEELTFTAPVRPATLVLTLTVTGRGGDVATDEVRVDVLEDAARAVFVDGLDGADAAAGGDGSRRRPFRSLAEALDRAAGADVYLRDLPGGAGYTTGDRALLGSLYGGYDAGWVRRRGSRAIVTGGTRGLVVSGTAIVSAIEVRGPDTGTDAAAFGVAVGAGADVRIEDSVVRAGSSQGSFSVGVVGEGADGVAIVRSTVDAGRAGRGADGRPGTAGGATSTSGEPGAGRFAGRGGTGGTPAAGNGGAGGDGAGGAVDGEPGEGGAGQGGEAGQPGNGGAGGAAGRGGRGGGGGSGPTPPVAPGAEPASPGADLFVPRGASGAAAARGGDGGGGAGGGGGGARPLHDGGGGGGGGGGGAAGQGGGPGSGGYGSVAVWLVDVARVEIRSARIQAGDAGDGGAGGSGGLGRAGRGGGAGASGITTVVDAGGDGGGGGGGGAGGQGGQGGGGAGGPSIGLLTVRVDAVTVADSTVRAGAGGDGGLGGVAGIDGTPGAAGGRGSGGGPGGAATGPRTAARRIPSGGGDSIGWWDDGSPARQLVTSRIEPGTPGRAGGEGGPAGRATATTF